MGDEKKTATKQYVVVFDQLDVNTGEFQSQGVGMPQAALTKSYFRGDTVDLTDEDAARHLPYGAVVLASDKRAKLVEANPVRDTGIRRDVDKVLPNAVALEELPAAKAGGSGATRTKAGKLGSEGELSKMKVTELKALAAEHGVEVERSDTRATLAKKLSKVSVPEEGAGTDVTDNPGQGKDESAPPEHQPDEAPEE